MRDRYQLACCLVFDSEQVGRRGMQNGGIWAMEAMDLVHLAEGRQERAKSSVVEP